MESFNLLRHVDRGFEIYAKVEGLDPESNSFEMSDHLGSLCKLSDVLQF